MKKEIFATTLLAVALLSGCGDRGGDCERTTKGVGAPKIEYKDPVAIIDLNSTTHTYVPSLGEYTIDRTHIENPFIYDGSRSQDNDENNQSITKYQWHFSHTFSPACVDINTSAGVKAVFRFANTDTNDTCQNEALNNGEINATLTVTDDEGKTASTTKSIKTN